VTVELRPAQPGDAFFLVEMVAAAATWRPGSRGLSLDELLRDPALAHYVEGWPRPGDLGVIAQDPHPIGAAWLRFLPETDPGFGFVDAHTPEVSLAVAAAYRGQGIGSRLLEALIESARSAGVARLSLSVESDNHALRLYERLGFEQIGISGGSVTMLLKA
jgi:ribosomal protein S18 acetylase RimI-like enzyme